MLLGDGAQPGKHAAAVAQHPNRVGADGTVALGVFVDLQQRDLVVAHEGEIPLQRYSVGNAGVAGHGGGAQAIHVRTAMPAPSEAFDAHAGAQAASCAAADGLQRTAALTGSAHQDAVAGHGPQPSVCNAQLIGAVVGAAHRRTVVEKGGASGDQPQLLRQGVLALFRQGDASAGDQCIQIPLEIGIIHAARIGKLRQRARHVGMPQNIVENFARFVHRILPVFSLSMGGKAPRKS